MTLGSRTFASRIIAAGLLPLFAACSGNVAPDEGLGWDTPDGGVVPGGAQGGPVGESLASGTTPDPSGTPTASCTVPNPGTAPLRRLSNAEYRNTLRDVFATVPNIDEVIVAATREFPSEPESLGFRNNAEFLTVQSVLAQRYMDAAEAIAREVAATLVLDCAERACARNEVMSLGERLYRRPLTADEVARYDVLMDQAIADYDVAAAIEWAIFTLLQSPQFLYRVETRAAGSSATPLASEELATRLAYTYWQSAPDSTLLDQVKNIDPSRPEAVEALAREMLADVRAERLFQFFSEWLDLDHLTDFQRDPEVFPDLEPELQTLLQEETRHFVTDLLGRPDGSFTELLTAPYTYANDALSRHYGLDAVEGDSFVRITSPERSGILTQSLLLSHDKPYRTSIVRRGLKIRSDLLCQNIPAPPNDVPLNLDATGASATQRERLEQHRTDPSCSGCHVALDTIGVVFENFDAVGRYRTLDEAGQPIVTASELVGTRDADGPVADVRQLGQRLAASQEVRDCYVKQTFRFFFGREVEAADACSIQTMQSAFQRSDYNLTELLVSLTQTDAFLFKPALEVTP